MIADPLSRRAVCAGLAAAVISSANLPASAASRPVLAPTGIGSAAARVGILWGSAVDDPVLSDEAYADLYRREARILTTQNALKFDWLRPDDGPIRFGPADRLVDFAAEAGLPIRGHTLIWNDNAPAWLKRLPAREIERVLDAHIEAVMTRYAGRLHSWDVVNEPFWPGFGKPGGYRIGPWYDAMGPDYVARAFKRAAQVDPGARLVLNEAQTERADALGSTMRIALLGLVDRLQDKGVPLHAVGLQGHILPKSGFDPVGFGRLLGELSRRGLAIYITEMDVDDHTLAAAPAERDAAVARYYREFLDVVLAEPKVAVIETWGLADPASWYQAPNVQRELGSSRPARPLLFDDAYARKPAWSSAMEALSRRRA